MITSTSDPATWAQLESLNTGAGWVILEGAHYRVLQLTNGSNGYELNSTLSLIDSRSLTKSKATSYTEAEIE